MIFQEIHIMRFVMLKRAMLNYMCKYLECSFKVSTGAIMVTTLIQSHCKNLCPAVIFQTVIGIAVTNTMRRAVGRVKDLACCLDTMIRG